MWLAAEDVFTFESQIVEGKIKLTKCSFLKKLLHFLTHLDFYHHYHKSKNTDARDMDKVESMVGRARLFRQGSRVLAKNEL